MLQQGARHADLALHTSPSQARIAQRQDAARAAAREARAEQHRATQAVANGGPVTQLEEDGGSVAAADAGELAADATPSPPVTRSAMRAAVVAAAQRRASSG